LTGFRLATRFRPLPAEQGSFGLLGLLDERYFASKLEPKTPASRLRNVDFRTSLFKPATQQDKAAFEVVFEFGKTKRLVETKPAVRKLHRFACAMFVQELPQYFGRQASHEILAVDKNALVALEVFHLDLRAARRLRRAIRTRLHR
jgi:hypothetical protein